MVESNDTQYLRTYLPWTFSLFISRLLSSQVYPSSIHSLSYLSLRYTLTFRKKWLLKIQAKISIFFFFWLTWFNFWSNKSNQYDDALYWMTLESGSRKKSQKMGKTDLNLRLLACNYLEMFMLRIMCTLVYVSSIILFTFPENKRSKSTFRTVWPRRCLLSSSSDLTQVIDTLNTLWQVIQDSITNAKILILKSLNLGILMILCRYFFWVRPSLIYNSISID